MNKQDEDKAREIARDTMYVEATGNYNYTTSVVESLCIQMAAWKEKQMIEKACEFFKDVFFQCDITDSNGYSIDKEKFYRTFERRMEE